MAAKEHRMNRWFAALAVAGCQVAAVAQRAPAPVAPSAPLAMKFDFGTGVPKAGYTQVKLDTAYSDVVGYGFEPGAPLSFSVKVPEGNYRVRVVFGDENIA